jgi:hypothetical protein
MLSNPARLSQCRGPINPGLASCQSALLFYASGVLQNSSARETMIVPNLLPTQALRGRNLGSDIPVDSVPIVRAVSASRFRGDCFLKAHWTQEPMPQKSHVLDISHY